MVNRPVAALEGVIGCFATLAPIRCAVAPSDTFAQLCTAMRAEFTELLRHQAVPVKHLTPLLPGVALAKVGFVVLNTRLPHAGRSVPISRMMLPTGTVKSRFALLVEPGDTITVTAEFDTAHYTQAVTARIVGTLRAVLVAALANPDTPVAALPGEYSLLSHSGLPGWCGLSAPVDGGRGR
jgi:non-ribosomal peptide synthetase component F